MARRVVVSLLIAGTLVLAGVGAYSHYFTPPPVPPADVPVFISPTAPPTESEQFARLAETDAVAMLAACLTNYEKEATGFRATLAKRERVAGKLHEPELIRVVGTGDVPGPDKKTAIRVRMIWDQGAKGDGNPLFLGEKKIKATLYAEGQLSNQMTIYRPEASVEVWHINPKIEMARKSSRYCITDAGMYRSMLRTYDAWKKRQEAGVLTVAYLGKRVIPEVGGRECFVVKRTCKTAEVDPFALDEQPPTDAKVIDRDGFTEVTLFIDAERRLQLGTVIRRTDGELVGEYYFRDVELVKAEFPSDTFTPAALRN